MSKQETFFRSLDDMPLTLDQKHIIITAAVDFAIETMKDALSPKPTEDIVSQWNGTTHLSHDKNAA